MDVFPVLFDNYFIKVIFLVHSALITLSTIAVHTEQHAILYNSYNVVFLIALMLAILADKNTDILLIAAGLNALGVLFDVFTMIVTYNNVFGILLMVANMLFRPLAIIFLLKNYSARAGVEDPTSVLLEVNVPSSSATRGRSAYHNIDEPNQALP